MIHFNRKVSTVKNAVIERVAPRSIRAYWWNSKPNFGDLFTPYLLRSYGVYPIHASPSRARLASTGSIIEHFKEDYNGVVLGSGLIKDAEKKLPNANVIAVRGFLTKERMGISSDVCVGDPGLLSRRLIKGIEPYKKYLCGVVPHFTDLESDILAKLISRLGESCTLIDVRSTPDIVINKISKCKYILSSSLHGIIVADALGIANSWIKIEDGVLGGGFKFRDYDSAVNGRHDQRDASDISGESDLKDICINPDTMINEVIKKIDLAFETFCKSEHITRYGK